LSQLLLVDNFVQKGGHAERISHHANHQERESCRDKGREHSTKRVAEMLFDV
jgi:hypothetical protein